MLLVFLGFNVSFLFPKKFCLLTFESGLNPLLLPLLINSQNTLSVESQIISSKYFTKRLVWSGRNLAVNGRIGAGDRNRTPRIQLWKAAALPLSYTAKICCTTSFNYALSLVSTLCKIILHVRTFGDIINTFFGNTHPNSKAMMYD